ncbi:MAG: TetR/AcrR family transcriptional regulator [Chloroflexi bacterium]|nr:MAG: TetR/AcrR family transcriptional regulator [Chloroflexota bacterium]
MQIPSNQQQPLNETEERIRTAALRLFAQKGFQATSTRELSAEAGLTVAGLYYYVGTKEALLLAITRDANEALLHSARRIGASDEAPERKLALLVQLHLWFHGEHALESRVINTELRSLSGEALQRALELRDGYEAVWRAILALLKWAEAFRTGIARKALSPSRRFALCMSTGRLGWYAQLAMGSRYALPL